MINAYSLHRDTHHDTYEGAFVWNMFYECHDVNTRINVNTRNNFYSCVTRLDICVWFLRIYFFILKNKNFILKVIVFYLFFFNCLT